MRYVKENKHTSLLPDGAEIARQRARPPQDRPTFEAIGAQYGVSRQAVHKAFKRWQDVQVQMQDEATT